MKTMAGGGSDRALELRQNMRKLWTDHVAWTRNYIIAAIADQPDAQAASKRLMKNQEDIGNAIADYYGKDAGTKLTGLLKEHILQAVDLIKAAKSGDQTAMKAADQKWQANADQIATLLSQANPNWPKSTVMDLMNGHVSTTKKEVAARLDKKWDDDVAAFPDKFSSR